MFSENFSISLGEFSQSFFDSIEDNHYIKGPALGDEQYFHTILMEGAPVGVVGYLPPKNISLVDTGFVQILLKPEYRGRGFMSEAYDLLAARHGLKTLYATIYKDNLTSIRAHQKIGFKLLSEEKMNYLRDKKLLDNDDLRLEKVVT